MEKLRELEDRSESFLKAFYILNKCLFYRMTVSNVRHIILCGPMPEKQVLQ